MRLQKTKYSKKSLENLLIAKNTLYGKQYHTYKPQYPNMDEWTRYIHLAT